MTPPAIDLRLLSVGSCRHPEWITLRGGRLGPAKFPSVCALLRHPRFGPVLYDTGYAERFFTATDPFPERFYRWLTPVRLPARERLAARLAGFGVTPADVRYCIISHLHADHVAGLRDLPNARFVLLRRELDAFATRGRCAQVRRGLLRALLPDDFADRLLFADDCRTLAPPPWRAALGTGFDLFGDGSVAGVPLAGHAPGQLGIALRDAGDRDVLLCADACWSRRALRERRPPSPLAGLLFDDRRAYRRTFERLCELSNAPDGPLIVPSHCAPSVADYARLVGA